MKQSKTLWQSLFTLTLLTVFFVLLFYTDNKYQTPPPYGKSGIITLHEQDFERNNPIFLIDGWLFSDERQTEQPTYIGEFSNLQHGDLSVSPHGKARYQLTLRYSGAPQIVTVDFPQLAFLYTISLDDIQISQGFGNGQITFPLTSGNHVLTVETSSQTGYYSGMYFPPALSTAETFRRVDNIQGFSYALAFILPLALAMFTLFLWRTGDILSRCLGLLCCFYALYMFRYFVFLFSMPVAKYWFAVQSVALYCLCFCVVQLTALISGCVHDKAWKWIRAVLLVLPVLLLLLCLFIPVLPWAVFVHGKLTDIYYLFTFCCTAYFAVQAVIRQSKESRYTLAGCFVFGAGLIINLFFANRFEPIRFFWQFEWCGLLLVILFGVMMVLHSRRILQENDALTNHLEEQVRERTKEVTQLLEERKAFFSDMAHDLKAPVFATQSFINAIRQRGIGVDTELMGYLEQAETKQQEMARRLQGLSTLNALDRIKEKRVKVSLKEFLEEIYDVHHAEAAVRSVHLFVDPPTQDAYLYAQLEKLNILFENLIYNALKATPCNGSITVFAQVKENRIHITVEDTGCGIPKEELPYIFQRFYVGAQNKDTGTGLGLYIVHSIVTELGGTINVSSTVGIGTKFVIILPQII